MESSTAIIALVFLLIAAAVVNGCDTSKLDECLTIGTQVPTEKTKEAVCSWGKRFSDCISGLSGCEDQTRGVADNINKQRDAFGCSDAGPSSPGGCNERKLDECAQNSRMRPKEQTSEEICEFYVEIMECFQIHSKGCTGNRYQSTMTEIQEDLRHFKCTEESSAVSGDSSGDKNGATKVKGSQIALGLTTLLLFPVFSVVTMV